MAKLLKKHFGLGGKKTSHRTDCNAQKSNSTQELTPKSPTRYRSSVSLSTSSHHDSFDTHSLKSYFGSGDSAQGQCSSNNRHEHSSSSKQHVNCCRHQGSCSKEQGSLSPRGSCSTDVTQHSFHNASVAEESDVFDESPLDGASLGDVTPTTSQMPIMPPPRVLDEYCDPVDLKKNVVSEGSNLLGACAPNNLQPDDDYSVPYEVKKIMPDGKLRERFMANSNGKCNGSPARSHDFDEPQEWLAHLSVTSGDNMPQHSALNQQTPMMTPKKTVRCSPQLNSDSYVHGTNDLQDSSGKPLSTNPSLPSDLTANLTELASSSSDDISGISSSVVTPTSAVTDESLSASELIPAEPSILEISREVEGGQHVLGVVEADSAVKLTDTDTAVVKHSVTSPTHSGPPSHGERCKHSSKHNNHHCSHGKSSNGKKSDRLHHSRSDESAETDNSGIFSLPNVKDFVPLDVPIEQQSWYHGPLGRIEAEELLRQQLQGSFLVRQSESNKLDYSLSLKSSNGFLHIKIVGQDGNYILGQFSQPFESIPRMVEFFCHAKLPLRGNEQISLMHPLFRGDRD